MIMEIKERLKQWAVHPDVQVGVSFFITSLMMQGFANHILRTAVADDIDPDLIVNCIMEAGQASMSDESGVPKKFIPSMLLGNLKELTKHTDKFIKTEIGDPDSELVTKIADKIREDAKEKGVRILSVSGYMEAGKDEFVSALEGTTRGVHNLKFADPLKYAASAMLGCSREQLEDQEYKSEYNVMLGMTNREFLQYFGTEAMRDTFGPSFWVKLMAPQLDKVISSAKEGDIICVSDTRFESELSFLTRAGAETYWISRAREPGSDLHTSETALDNSVFGHVVNNKGTLDEFHTKVRELVDA